MPRCIAALVLLVSGCSSGAGDNHDQARAWIGQPVWSLVKRYSLVRIELAPGPADTQKLSYKMPLARGLCDLYVTSKAVDGDYIISDMTTGCPPGVFSQR